MPVCCTKPPQLISRLPKRRTTFKEFNPSSYEPRAAGLFGIDHSRRYVRRVLQDHPPSGKTTRAGPNGNFPLCGSGTIVIGVRCSPWTVPPRKPSLWSSTTTRWSAWAPPTCSAHAGYRVLEAGSAAEALRLFETNADVRLLFTDVSMPGSMSGADLACDVARRWPAIGIIVTSGRPRPLQAAVEHALSRQAV